MGKEVPYQPSIPTVKPGKEIMVRADIFAPGETIPNYEEQLYHATNRIIQGRALENKFGTRLLNWDTITWSDGVEEESVIVGVTKLTAQTGRLKGKKVECWILGRNKDRRFPHTFYDKREWRAFIGGVNNKEFDKFGNNTP